MYGIVEDYLKQFNILSQEDISEAIQHFTPLSLNQNEFFIKEGEVCNKVGFLLSGVLRTFYISSKFEEVTYCLNFPTRFVTAYSSYITQKPTIENIHAITDVELLTIQHSTFSKLVESNTNWLKFYKIISENTYLEMEKRMILFQMESAEKRYEDLIQNYPEYLQNVPLKYLASYLGVSQRHLSRLRKQISF